MAAPVTVALSATLPLVRRVRLWQWTALDCLGAALFLLPILGGAGRAPNPDKPWLDVVAVACSAVFIARRRYPVLVLTLLIAGVLVLTKSQYHPYRDYQPLGLMLTLYTVAAERPRWVSAIAMTAGCLTATWIMWSRGSGPGSTLMTGIAVGVAPPLAGYFKRETIIYADAFSAEQSRKTEAEVTARLADERMRIARELHDVVAHALSLITVQAGVAVFREHDAAQLRETLSSVETTGRGALMDMRRLLGVLRGTSDAADADVTAALSDYVGSTIASAAQSDGGQPASRRPERSPMPGLDDLGLLVSQTAQAGLRVSLHVEGERQELSAGLELAAYRIVQESLTNVLRHARTATGTVSVRHAPGSLTVVVTNPASRDALGGGGGGAGAGGEVVRGHGLLGMAERVAMYNGELSAARTPSGGFAVVASFPTAPAASEPDRAGNPGPSTAGTPSTPSPASAVTAGVTSTVTATVAANAAASP
jgi:signal transduction histidine kinase